MGGVFTREERAVVLFLVVSVVVGTLVLGVGRVDPSTGDAAPEAQEALGESDAGPLRVNVNAADASELERLPGIGPARAEAIVRLRAERGRFETVDELADVRGIGPVTLDGLRPFAVVADTAACPGSSAPSVE